MHQTIQQAEITMKSTHFRLDIAPPTVNHYWIQKGFRKILSKRAVEFRKEIKKACEGQAQFDREVSVSIAYYPPDKRKRDIDNILKPLLDALQCAGVFNDDYQVKTITATRHDVCRGGAVSVYVIDYSPNWIK